MIAFNFMDEVVVKNISLMMCVFVLILMSLSNAYAVTLSSRKALDQYIFCLTLSWIGHELKLLKDDHINLGQNAADFTKRCDAEKQHFIDRYVGNDGMSSERAVKVQKISGDMVQEVKDFYSGLIHEHDYGNVNLVTLKEMKRVRLHHLQNHWQREARPLK
jgi:hypothetical protein